MLNELITTPYEEKQHEHEQLTEKQITCPNCGTDKRKYGKYRNVPSYILGQKKNLCETARVHRLYYLYESFSITHLKYTY